MKIQITAHRSGKSSAWSKAPADAAVIASRAGYAEFDIDAFRILRGSFLGRVLNKLSLLKLYDFVVYVLLFACLEYKFKHDGGGTLFVQFPGAARIFDGNERIQQLYKLKKLKVHIVMLIHDLGSLRGESSAVGGKTDTKQELEILRLADTLIVHNAKMKEWCAEQGIPAERMVELGVFDYLCPRPQKTIRNVIKGERPIVAVAGGLGGGKAAYVESLKNFEDITWRLFGNGYEENKMSGATVKYCGCWPQDVIPSKLDADFGLVWDGDDVDTCSGGTGKYLLYNNPHKLSLYLASELPVIVWEKSAVADFVKKHGIGITVASLHEINQKISQLEEKDCKQMKMNLSVIAEQVRQGFFLGKVLESVR